MIVTAIKHKAGSGVDEALRKLDSASDGADIVFGPDYALAHDMDRPNTVSEYMGIKRDIHAIAHSKGSLIFAGTMPVRINGRMELVCPVASQDGAFIRFQKETDRGEAALAEKHGLKYQRGDCNTNNYTYKDRGNISVAICSDHGHQEVPENTFLEAILAYDQRAGFWTDVNTKKFPRHIVVCDSFAPKVEGFRFDEAGTLKIWEAVDETDNDRTYEIK